MCAKYTILAVRREYLKARARKHRWNEEVELLKEEMRRVLRYLQWRADWWRARETRWEDLDAEVSDGLRAYAARQAAGCIAIMVHFRMKWDEKVVRTAMEAPEVDINLGETFIA